MLRVGVLKPPAGVDLLAAQVRFLQGHRLHHCHSRGLACAGYCAGNSVSDVVVSTALFRMNDPLATVRRRMALESEQLLPKPDVIKKIDRAGIHTRTQIDEEIAFRRRCRLVPDAARAKELLKDPAGMDVGLYCGKAVSFQILNKGRHDPLGREG